MRIGSRLRAIRKEAKITLDELSSSSGIALATLSRIENNRMTGTLESHIAICKALKISLTELYKDILSPGETETVLCSDTRPEILTQNKQAVSELLIPRLSGKKMIPVLTKIASRSATTPEQGKKGIEKFIFVADGSIDAVIGDQSYVLNRGDSLYFDSSMTHSFQNRDNGEARVLTIASSPLA